MVRLLPWGLRRLGQPRGHIPPVGRRRVRPAERTAPGGQQLVVSHPLQTAAAMGIAGITRPSPRRRMLHQSGSDRIEVHVSGYGPEVALIFDQFGTIAALKHMPGKAVAPRPNIGIAGQKRLHAASEVRLWSLEDDVQVVRHDGEGVYAPGTANCGFTEVFLEPITVDVVAYDDLTAIAASHEM